MEPHERTADPTMPAAAIAAHVWLPSGKADEIAATSIADVGAVVTEIALLRAALFDQRGRG